MPYVERCISLNQRMMFIVIVLGIIFPRTLPAESPRVGGVSRPNLGVDFNFIYQINNMHGSWKHAWVVDIQLLHRPAPKFGDVFCKTSNVVLCQGLISTALEGSQLIWNSTTKFSEMHSWLQDPHILQTLNRGVTSRGKRSLLPFIGDIEKFLFGVATESDIAGMKNTLTDMQKLQEGYSDEIVRLGNNLASVTKIVNEDLATSKKGLKILHDNFKNLTRQVNERFKDVTAEISGSSTQIEETQVALHQLGIVMVHLIKLASETQSLMVAEISLLQGIQQILSGFIPITLVRPQDLQQGLRVAREGIKEVFPTATLSYPETSLGYYYTHKIVTPIIESNKITLLVDIPVDLEQQILNVYAVRTFPVPLNNNPIMSDQMNLHQQSMSKLHSDHDYFMVSQDGKYYSYGEHGDVALCKGETIRFCPKQFPLFTMEENSCLQQLWLDAPFRQILDICPYELHHRKQAVLPASPVQVIPLSEGKWYIVSPLEEHWAITCPSRPPESRKSCTSCVVQVSCGCGILSKHFRIPTRVDSCNEASSPLKHNYSVNPFSYVKEEKSWFINLTGSELLNHPNFRVPNIDIPSSENWDDVMESMDSKTYDLNRLYQKQNNETKQFRSVSEALLEKIKHQDQFLQSLAGWPDWVVGLGIGLSFCNSIVLGLLIFCFLKKGVSASSIVSRYDIEQPIHQSSESAVISLEVIMLLILIFNTALLLVLSWPIISNWINNRTWMRKASQNMKEVKAIGYVKRKNGTNIVLHGVLRFSTSTVARAIPVRILLGCLPGGWHLSDPRADRTKCTVLNVGHYYHASIQDPITVISTSDGITILDVFSLALDTLHQATEVPIQNRLTSIEDVMLIPEAV